MCANCIVSNRLQKKTSRQFLWTKYLLVLANQKYLSVGAIKVLHDVRLLSCLLLRAELITSSKFITYSVSGSVDRNMA